ncbi:uncharacterized protein LOC113312161 [Papaver somniferum]|uniref:uncharacterized protein LOC113312161 n=1 Tax=Papaver somniferum TaxID=3469 RepID=UPI000E704CD2|nr:uncharacterized protein LOC113312161 [Papaver somniferum]
MEIASTLNKPWLVIGDFNTITSVDEKKGGLNPLKISMREFNDCLNNCGLIQAPKTGLEFSWCNNRAGKKRILCNLDRVVFNDKWLEVYPSRGYKVGVRSISDHGILYGANAKIPKPKNIHFRDLKIFEEVKRAVFELDPDSSPGPYGFAGWFYRYAWEIVGNDLTKIITTRFGSLIQRIVSPQQGAFIKGRNIQEQIVIDSELVNELDVKRRGVLLNGGPMGYFQVGRGLRQGDPLSPILFVIAEDLLRIAISRMVQSVQLQPMLSRNDIHPSHIFFADDVFLFCNGDKRNAKKLATLLKEYQEASGQIFNLAKSKCFIGGTSTLRKQQIASECRMPLANFPDKYLGVYLTPGRIKTQHIWNCVEQIQASLAGWMGKLLSFQERLILIKHVLSSIPIYSMSVYKWPQRALKDCEQMIRNFLWTGDPSKRKSVVLKLDKVCSPFEEGGLGLRRLEIMNKALLMKLWWKIQNNKEDWAKFFQEKFITKKRGLDWIL